MRILNKETFTNEEELARVREAVVEVMDTHLVMLPPSNLNFSKDFDLLSVGLDKKGIKMFKIKTDKRVYLFEVINNSIMLKSSILIKGESNGESS